MGLWLNNVQGLVGAGSSSCFCRCMTGTIGKEHCSCGLTKLDQERKYIVLVVFTVESRVDL